MITDRTRTSMISTVRLLDDAGSPIPGRLFSDAGLSVGYKREGDTVWTNLTLVAGTLGTYLSSSWIQDSGADGLYELGIPDVSRLNGKRTLWRFKHGANQYRYDAIDYIAVPSQSTDAIEFDFNIPGAGVIFSNNPVIYIKELGIQVKFTANQDITSENLVIIFESADTVDSYIVTDASITKVGDTATITLPAGFTDQVKSLNWAIREATTLRVYGIGTIAVTYAPHEDV